MKVYLAISKSYCDYCPDGYSVLRVFARREDAEAYELADGVIEVPLDEQPLEVRPRHVVAWDDNMDQPPTISFYDAGFDGRPESEETMGSIVQAETWNLDTAKAAFAAKHAEYEAERDRRAAELVEDLYVIEVQVWYEPGDGNAVLLTPLHTTDDHFTVPRDLITEQAGLPDGAYLHGKWFTVETLTYKQADGFKVCENPRKDSMATRAVKPAEPFRWVP